MLLILRKNYIYEKVLDTYKKCNVTEFPIDCFDILQHMGIKYIKYSSLSDQKQKKCRLISDDAFQVKGNCIYYNDTMIERRIRFSLMHELGHIQLCHANATSETEDEADFFASQMLMPHVAIYRLNCKTADDIHDTFMVSYAAANRALKEHRYWNGSKAETEISHLLFPPLKKPVYSDKEPRIKPEEDTYEKKSQLQLEIEERAKFINTFFSNDEIWAMNENFRLYGEL